MQPGRIYLYDRGFVSFALLAAHYDQEQQVQSHFVARYRSAGGNSPVLLMKLHTGHRPSKYLYALLGQVGAGVATLDEILPILRERERQSELARKSAARRREKKRQQAP